AGASSSERLACHRRPEQREVRVERERAREPGPRGAAVAEAALDHSAVEELERVPCAEPERMLRIAERLLTTAVPRQRPREDVIAVDRWPFALRAPSERERLPQPQTVVDVEEGR